MKNMSEHETEQNNTSQAERGTKYRCDKKKQKGI